jgi:hypothetical protein
MHALLDAQTRYRAPLFLLGGRRQGPYIVVADPDAHMAMANAAGAKVVYGICDEG